MTIAISGTTGITLDGQFNSASTFGFKNRIINSAMVIDQRNAGASVTPTNGQFLVDRYKVSLSQTSKFTAQQNAGSVTPPVGFSNYLGFTSSSSYSSLSGDYFWLEQLIEAYNVSDLSFGTASASSISVSFWARSSLTGTWSGSIANSAQDRSYPFTYTINSANTWEYKTVTIVGDTTGTWISGTNGVGFRVRFDLGTGSTYRGTAGAWAATQYIGATGSNSLVGTNGATLYITGVQLEKGSTATSFDYRPYGTEVALCLRYFQKSYNTDVAVGTNTASGSKTTRIYNTDPFLPQMETRLMVSMRASPTVTWYTTGGTAGSINISGGTNTINTQYDTGTNSTGWMYVNGSVASGNQIQAQYTASSEL